jgi:hypothetical protein
VKQVGGIIKRTKPAPSESMMGHCYILSDALTEAEQRVQAGEKCVIIARIHPPYRGYEAPRYVCFTEWIYRMFATIPWVDYVVQVPPLPKEAKHGDDTQEKGRQEGRNISRTRGSDRGK